MGGFGQRRSTPTSLTAQILSRLDSIFHFTHYRLASRSSHYELLGLTTGKTTRSTRMGDHHPHPLPTNCRPTYRQLLPTMGSELNRPVLPTTTPTPFKSI
jgi:hypothetical protein